MVTKAFWTSMTMRAGLVGSGDFSWAFRERERRRRGERERNKMNFFIGLGF
jgi:hypothetical protein